MNKSNIKNKLKKSVTLALTFALILQTLPASAADTTAPSIPATLTATAVSSTQINLSWTASTDDVGVTGYKIYRCTGSACAPTTQIATSATNSYSDTGPTASTAYTYAVSAYDAVGNESGKSSSISATTQASSILFQDDFEGAPLSNARPGQWNYIGTLQATSPDDEGFNGGHALKTDYQYIGREGFPEFTAIAKFANPSGNPIYIRWYQKWSDNWVWPSSQQKFLVPTTEQSQGYEFSIVNNRNQLAFIYLDMNINKQVYINPSWHGYSPGGRKDDINSTNHLDSENTCNAYGDPCGAVKFKNDKWYSIEVAVYKDSNKGWAKYWIDDILAFSAENLNTTEPINNITKLYMQHIYTPKDQQHPEMFTWMDNVEVSTQYIGPIGTPDTQAPTAPTNLTALAISSSQINLSWTASTDDVGVAGYKIYRCAGSACAPTTQIATSATNSYSNTGLTASTAYTYAVSAYDAAGNNSNQSASASAATQALPDTTPPTGTVSINAGAAYLNSTSATLTLSATDSGSGMGAGAQMQFSNDNLVWSAAEAYAVTKSWTLTTGDGAKTVYVKYKDAAGNWSETVSDTIILDITPPVRPKGFGIKTGR